MKLHFFCLLVIFLPQFSVLRSCHDDERTALLDFKSFLTDPSARLSSWQGQNCCNWLGIGCSNSSHVTVVNLRNPSPDGFIRSANSELVPFSNSRSTAIIGTIAPSLFKLQNLRYLDLSFNNFQFSKIPSEIANLKNLTYLNLSNAMFQDRITTQFANLSSLQFLDLSCSSLVVDFSSVSLNLSSLRATTNSSMTYIPSGHVSSTDLSWLRGLHNLRVLVLTGVDLSEASLSTNWAEPISFVYDLRLLHLSNCRISSPVPIYQFLNLSHLANLRMNSNYLSSSIPIQLANLSSLLVLDLASNKLKGSLPYLPQLQVFDMGENHDLTIDLTSMFVFPWPKLQELKIPLTNVIGSIPTSISNTTSLISFSASTCSIQGSIPPTLWNLSNLQSLDLSSNDITDNLSSSISNLKSLQFLHLFQNNLQGPIPESICDISSLNYLNLGSNNFSGRLPDCMAQLSKLNVFFISGNSLDGTVSLPPSLFQSSTPLLFGLGSSGLTVKVDQHPYPSHFQPKMLDLHSCNLRANIPDFISNLTELVWLDLNNNSLTGTIPNWLFQLPKLSFLDLSYNNLQGILPASIQLHPYYLATTLNVASNNLQGPIPMLPETIEVLDLSFNNFIGKIPTQIGEQLQNAIYLSFSGNKLTGPIPQSLCPPNNVLLENLDLSYNSLSGVIPPNLGNCRSLISLNLGANNLTGNIPNELKWVTSLSSLQLNDNHLEGTFPSFTQRHHDLEFLNLGSNQLEGKIPNFIGELRSLRLLVLKSNFFNGSIPDEINNLQKLQVVDFSNNKLFGPIPSKLGGLETLKSRPKNKVLLGFIISLMFAGVELKMVSKGREDQYGQVFSYTSGIDLSGNFLTGKIPQEIGLLQGLYMLNLSHNHLWGEIPSTIGNMSGLESLDLSFNNLSGEVPTMLTSLDSLSYLNLSYNNLSGRIPTGMHFDTLSGDGSAYTGNAFLCGVTTLKTCDKNGFFDPEMTGVEDGTGRETLLIDGTPALGFIIGFCGLLGALALTKDKWLWNKYWMVVDKMALRIIKCTG